MSVVDASFTDDESVNGESVETDAKFAGFAGTEVLQGQSADHCNAEAQGAKPRAVYDYQTALSVRMAPKHKSTATFRLNLPINSHVGTTVLKRDDSTNFHEPAATTHGVQKEHLSLASHVLVDTKTLEVRPEEVQSVKALVEKYEAWTKSHEKQERENETTGTRL